ncbi:hypothetical protein MRX96_011704 [Rhipicephalus microplus]
MERAAVRAALEAAAARAPVALCVREARVGVQGLPQRARARGGLTCKTALVGGEARPEEERSGRAGGRRSRRGRLSAALGGRFPHRQ